MRSHTASRAPFRSGRADVAGSGAASRDRSQAFVLLASQSLCCAWPLPSSVHTTLYPLSADTHSEGAAQLSAFLRPCERRARSLKVIRGTPSRSHGGEWNSPGLGFSPFRDSASSTGKCVHPGERGRDRKWEVWPRCPRLQLRPGSGFKRPPAARCSASARHA